MTRWTWMPVLLAVMSLSCSPRFRSGIPDADADSSDWIRVSDSSQDIASAKRLSKSQDRDADGPLNRPESIWYVDQATEELLTKNRETVIPKLVAVIESPTRNSKERARAASLLVRLRDRRGSDALATQLGSPISDECVSALREIPRLHSVLPDSQPHFDFLLEHASITDLLIQQLDHSDPEVVKAAIQANGMANTPQHIQKFRVLIRRGGNQSSARLAYWLARNGEASVVIGDIEQFCREGMSEKDVSNVAGALNHLAEKGDDSVRRRVVLLIREYYERGDIDHAKYESSSGWQLMSIIADYADLELVDWLKSRLPDTEPIRRGKIYKALTRLEADGWKPMVLEALHPNETVVDASQALADKFRGTEDAQIVDALTSRLSGKESEQITSAICSALITVGGERARLTVEKHLDQVDPWTRMDLIWQLRGMTLERVEPIIIETGVLTDAEVELAFAKADRSKEPQSLFLGLLADANRLLAFDVETGTLPCRHDQLLLSFAGISNGLFQPSDVSEAWHQQYEDDFEADYTLRFVVDGRYYEGRLRNHGDWYDVERLVAIANRALADSRHGERFLPLYSGGQVAFFTFGVPERFEQLATAIALPLENDPDRAMKEGKEFERQVLEKYGGSGAVVK